jgi:hypothetical protein
MSSLNSKDLTIDFSRCTRERLTVIDDSSIVVVERQPSLEPRGFSGLCPTNSNVLCLAS